MATLDLRGLPETKAMLEQFVGRELVNRMRRAVRAGGNEFKSELADTAASEPTGNLPKTFQKVRVRVSSSMRRGGVPTAIVRPASPLFNIFEPGAQAHRITPGIRLRNSARPSRPSGTSGGANFNVTRRGRPVLGGPAGARWRGAAFFSLTEVRHPGMQARPILPTAFASGEDDAARAASRKLFEGVS